MKSRSVWISPDEIVSGLDGDPIVAIDWPRPDFRAATLEFLIGLLATACPPEDEDAWLDLWHKPPGPETLAAALAPLAAAFALDGGADGTGPRFMQDFENLPGEPDLPETLLIEAPGEAGRRNNTTLLVKPDRVKILSRPAAAIALFTLQTYAPAGGRGNLTSLRGGGPLTTLAVPGGRPSLWHTLWGNVPCGDPAVPDDLPKIFPWLAPTRTADRFPATVPGPDAHRLQAFWGMPRRIRLNFSANPDGRACDLTGVVDDIGVTGWRQRPNGVKYIGWSHPLSPSYRTPAGEWLPVHPQPGGIGYRHWSALVVGGAAHRPAPCVAAWWRARGVPSMTGPTAYRARLLACGYDMDNMKARAFVESEMPLPGDGDPDDRAKLAAALIGAADQAARAARMAVRLARYDDDAGFDSGPMATVFEAFWQGTEAAFFARLASENPYDPDTSGREWLQLLRRVAMALFDEAAPLDPSAGSLKPERIVDARRQLMGAFAGHGAFGAKLFLALGLPLPVKTKTKRKEPA